MDNVWRPGSLAVLGPVFSALPTRRPEINRFLRSLVHLLWAEKHCRLHVHHAARIRRHPARVPLASIGRADACDRQ